MRRAVRRAGRWAHLAGCVGGSEKLGSTRAAKVRISSGGRTWPRVLASGLRGLATFEYGCAGATVTSENSEEDIEYIRESL